MSGMRAAMIYTWNENIKEVLTHLAEFHQLPAPMQHSMRHILQDKGLIFFLVSCIYSAYFYFEVLE